MVPTGCNSEEKVAVRLKINQPYDSFGPDEQRRFLDAVGSLLYLKGGIQVIDKRQGCVELTIELERGQAERLLSLLEQGVLDRYGITSVEIIDSANHGIAEGDRGSGAKSLSSQRRGKVRGSNYDETSLALLERLQQDIASEAAWDDFVRLYGPMVYDWCLKLGLQGADADDVAQQVLLKLTGAMRSFRFAPARSFRAWLRTVVHNAWHDWAAARRRQAIGSGDSQVLRKLYTVEARADLEKRLEEAFNRELLETAMHRVRQRVTSQTWEAFRLTGMEGLSGAEAAERLGITVANVYMARHRVRALLRDEIRRLERTAD